MKEVCTCTFVIWDHCVCCHNEAISTSALSVGRSEVPQLQGFKTIRILKIKCYVLMHVFVLAVIITDTLAPNADCNLQTVCF
jgi:hypothetical protein